MSLLKIPWTRWAQAMKPYQEWLWLGIFVQALVATAGSLYFSTFGEPMANLANGNFFPPHSGFTPCLLCWFARILMYPVVILSYVGMAKKDKHFTDYILPLAVLGIVLESYHYALQKLPIQSLFGCSLENPCSALQVNYFGFMTIPFLALIAFIDITVLAGLNTLINTRSGKVKKTLQASRRS